MELTWDSWTRSLASSLRASECSEERRPAATTALLCAPTVMNRLQFLIVPVPRTWLLKHHVQQYNVLCTMAVGECYVSCQGLQFLIGCLSCPPSAFISLDSIVVAKDLCVLGLWIIASDKSFSSSIPLNNYGASKTVPVHDLWKHKVDSAVITAWGCPCWSIIIVPFVANRSLPL